MRVGVAVIDIFTGVYATSAILAAIEVRHRTGEGQHIDMALLDVGMAVLANQAAGFLNSGQVPQRQGNTHPSLAPYQSFDTEDGAVLLAIGNDGQFARFCEVAGHSEWAQDARFASNTLRVQHRDALIALMQTVTRTRSTVQWITSLEDKAVPCGPINDIGQAFADPQVHARGLVIKQRVAQVNKAPVATSSIAFDTLASTQPGSETRVNTGAGMATVSTVASPLRLTATPPVLCRPPPRLGEHTDEVLAELGLSAADITSLRQRRVV
jgi:formyl-CoA transferase